jgi:hypothetical protein
MTHRISAGFGPFYCDGVEILRRIFVSVRDRNWNEVLPTEWNGTVNATTRVITVRARHVSELVDFAWLGTVQVSENQRSLQFEFQGEAQRTMEICRLGLVALHPVEALLGARVQAVAHDSQQTIVVSSIIAPQTIVDGVPLAMTQPFSKLLAERADLGALELEFRGDLFEIEDQRNWGDASFKTYCTPLRLGFPRQITAGTRIAHRLKLRFTPPVPKVSVRAAAPKTVSGVFPTIGRMQDGAPPAGRDDPAWHHVHVDLGDGVHLEERLLDHKDNEGPCWEIAFNEQLLENERVNLVSLIAENRRRVARLLLYGTGASPPSSASIEHCRSVFRAARVNLPIFAATRGYFVEFNRTLAIQPEFRGGVSFPLTGTVHSDDALTVAENVLAIRDIADTVRLKAQARAVAIAPLALYYPSPPARPRFSPDMVAPWLAAMTLQAAAAGAGSITLAEDIRSVVPKEFIGQLLRCARRSVTLLGGQTNGVHCALLTQAEQPAAQLIGINLGTEPGTVSLKSVAHRIRSLIEVRDHHPVSLNGACIDVESLAVTWLECELV